MADSAKNENKNEKTAKQSAKQPAKQPAKPGFFKGVKAEFKKISWPDRESVIKQSVAVVCVSVVLGAIIAVLDFIMQYGVGFLTSL